MKLKRKLPKAARRLWQKADRRLLVALLVATAVILSIQTFAAPRRSPAESPKTFQTGAAVNQDTDLRTDLLPAQAARLQEAGAKWARVAVYWHRIEGQGDNVYRAADLALLDAQVQTLRDKGIGVMLLLHGEVPCWASGDPGKDCVARKWDGRYPPNHKNHFEGFSKFIADRYKNQGVHHFEIWNEPNHDHFLTKHNPGDYLDILEAGSRGVRSGDLQAVVVGGSLAPVNNTATSTRADQFLARVYDLSRQRNNGGPGILYDILSVHLYPNEPGLNGCPTFLAQRSVESVCHVEDIRNVMLWNGDGHKPIWITETGVTYGLPDNSPPFAIQAAEYRQAYHLYALFDAMARYEYIKVGMWFNAQALPPDGLWSHLHNFGMLNVNREARTLTPKPAYNLFRAWRDNNPDATIVYEDFPLPVDSSGRRAEAAVRVMSFNDKNCSLRREGAGEPGLPGMKYDVRTHQTSGQTDVEGRNLKAFYDQAVLGKAITIQAGRPEDPQFSARTTGSIQELVLTGKRRTATIYYGFRDKSLSCPPAPGNSGPGGGLLGL